jgi:hypothetical protein
LHASTTGIIHHLISIQPLITIHPEQARPTHSRHVSSSQLSAPYPLLSKTAPSIPLIDEEGDVV